MHDSNPIALAVTGASGALYALRLLEVLVQQGVCVDVMLSSPGQIVISMETDLKLPGRPAEIQRVLQSESGDHVTLTIFYILDPQDGR